MGLVETVMVESLLGFVLQTFGEILVAWSVIKVHSRVAKEKKIDKATLLEIRKERNYAAVGIVLILIGFVMQIL